MAAIPIQSQTGFLFSKPAPAGREVYRRASRKVQADPDSLVNRWKRIFCFDPAQVEGIPLVLTGYARVRIAEEKQDRLTAQGGRR